MCTPWGNDKSLRGPRSSEVNRSRSWNQTRVEGRPPGEIFEAMAVLHGRGPSRHRDLERQPAGLGDETGRPQRRVGLRGGHRTLNETKYPFACATSPSSSSSASAAASSPAERPGAADQLVGRDRRVGDDCANLGGRPGERGRLGRRRRVDPDRLEHVGRAGDRRRAEPEQRVRPLRELRGDLARDGEHLAALVEREVGGDQRAAPLARLDDDASRARGRRRSGCGPESATARARRRADTRTRSDRVAAICAASAACARG